MKQTFKQTPEDFDAAIARLKRYGWARGVSVGAGGQRCMIGAFIAKTGGNRRTTIPLYLQDVNHFIGEVLNDESFRLAPGRPLISCGSHWNDNFARDLDEVIAVLELCRDLLRHEVKKG